MEFCDLKTQYKEMQADMATAIQQVLESGRFVLGPQVADLEKELAAFLAAERNPVHAITCANGTDALQIALMALGVGPGDEVVTTPFTFFATAEAIALVGAKPIFCDIEEDTYNLDASKLEACITPRTKVILPVSLYGQPADFSAINEIALRHGVVVLEDAAQSFGATYKGAFSGNLCPIATTSFFPAKPLGCYGDGGAVFCQQEELAKRVRLVANHGSAKRYYHEIIGLNSRLDTLQAAILLVKLKRFSAEVVQRQALANRYSALLAVAGERIVLPKVRDDRSSVWAQYTVRVTSRDLLGQYLQSKGIPTAVHYPMPLHLQPCFAGLGLQKGCYPVAEKVASEVISLPMSAQLSTLDQDRVAEEVLAWLH